MFKPVKRMCNTRAPLVTIVMYEGSGVTPNLSDIKILIHLTATTIWEDVTPSVICVLGLQLIAPYFRASIPLPE